MNSEDFQNIVLDNKEPAVVDFWATWCGPCKMLAPTIEELASELEGKIAVGKVDVDKNGEEVTRLIGVQSREKLLETANKLL